MFKTYLLIKSNSFGAAALTPPYLPLSNMIFYPWGLIAEPPPPNIAQDSPIRTVEKYTDIQSNNSLSVLGKELDRADDASL